MPGLDTTLHLDMLRKEKKQLSEGQVYGMQWGDPETMPTLCYVRERYVVPFVDSKQTAIEIGPGGGRWTQYLQGFKKLYAIDYYQEMLDELAKTFNKEHIVRIKNNGTDFPNVPDESIDFVFSFDTFVHLDIEIIDEYLIEMFRVMKQGAYAVIHYSDKTKDYAFKNPGFSVNSPELMRSMIRRRGFVIRDESTTATRHSSIVCFTKNEDVTEFRACTTAWSDL